MYTDEIIEEADNFIDGLDMYVEAQHKLSSIEVGMLRDASDLIWKLTRELYKYSEAVARVRSTAKDWKETVSTVHYVSSDALAELYSAGEVIEAILDAREV